MPRSLLFVCSLGVTQEEQLLAIRYVFLLLPDETRDVLETILRFLLDVSIRSGNSQVKPVSSMLSERETSLDLLDNLSESRSDLRSIDLSIVSRHAHDLVEDSLVEMEERQARCYPTGERTFDTWAVSDDDDSQCWFTVSSRCLIKTQREIVYSFLARLGSEFTERWIKIALGKKDQTSRRSRSTSV